MAFLIAILADAITGEGIAFANGPLGWGNWPFFALGIPKVTFQPLKLGKNLTRSNALTHVFCHVIKVIATYLL